jgi:tRNA A37 methylthiotransferase MiaB
MKILLIDPPMQSIMKARADWYPMGLAYLAGSAVREGHEVLIFNGEHDPGLDYVNLTTYSSNYHLYLDALENPSDPAWKRVASAMAEFGPDVVGITSNTVKIPSAMRVAAIAKDLYPDVPVIVGGQHATILPENVLYDPHIDFVVRGEGEQTFAQFLHRLNGDRLWEKVAGLSFKGNGGFIHNPPRPLLSNLDELPFPARQCLHDIEHYEPQSLSKLFASRGCPFRCNYCGSQNIWTHNVRHHSAARIVEEIRQVRKEYGATYFTFLDDVFGVDKKRAMELTREMAGAKLGIRWDCLTRANLVSDELLVSMKKAGCAKIDMGVESGSDRVLKDTQKGLNTKQIIEAGRRIKKHGIFLYAFFMIGLPTETEEDARLTKKFIAELKPDWAGISIFTPLPGTGIYEDLRKQGKIHDKPDFARFSHQSPHSNFAFGMSNREAFPVLAQEMIEFVQNYNGSCRNLIKRGLSRGYHRNIGLLFSDLKKVATWKGLIRSGN